MTATKISPAIGAAPSRLRVLREPGRFSAPFLLAAFIVVFGLLNDQYLTATTVRLVLTEGAVTGVLALAFLVPFAGGTFDLSIGAVMGLSLVITNWIGANLDWPPSVGVLVALAACSTVGLISGLLVVRLRVNSFIATLGVSQLVAGLVLLISDNRQITNAFSDTYKQFGRRDIFGLPVIVIYLLVIAVAIWYVMEHTPTGRRLLATGNNVEAARLAGLPTGRIIICSLVSSALLAGIAGVMFSMKVGTFSTAVGPGYLFPAIAAVFFGASQFSGRPNVWGTIVAFYALEFGIKGLQLLAGVGTVWISPLFQGTALIFAVALASNQGHLRRRPRHEEADVAPQGASAVVR